MEKVSFSTMAVTLAGILLGLIFWGIPAAEGGETSPVWVLLGVVSMGVFAGVIFSKVKLVFSGKRV